MASHDQLLSSLRYSSARFVLPAFAATLFTSALLLFAIQPMFTKMVLPVLGGSSSLWSVAMVFFQASLLVGYGYAHLLARLPVTRSALIHLAVLGAAALTLPIAIAPGFGDPPSDGIGLWLLVLFASSIGLPFAVLSASAPLLQHWFATSEHPHGRNPYVLYAASNLGSFVALLAYPLVIEPLLPLRLQSWIWSLGFAGLALLIAGIAVTCTRNTASNRNEIATSKVTGRQRVVWLALSAVPAGLVVAVTAYISTDVAAVPLLWVLPLALYLLTFVAVFRTRPWLSQKLVAATVPFFVAPLSISLLSGDREFWLATIVLNVAAFVALTMLCHAELYARRPNNDRLTEFYFWTSLGGVIGGAFSALLAPHIFDRTFEYPILIVLALCALPGFACSNIQSFVAKTWPALAAFILAALVWKFDLRLDEAATVPFQIALVGLTGAMLIQRRDPIRFMSLVVVALVATALWQPGSHVIERARSFFGVHQVEDVGAHRLLLHGTTIHGAERISAGPRSGKPEPLTYYYVGGPLSETVTAARARQGHLNNVAVVGLGAGSLACHRSAGEDWTFFEIDPEVVRLATDTRYFHFLSECAPDASIVLGDARLTLARSNQSFDLIILDAFSSDAIPVHLLTREALQGYISRLSPHGMIVFHISNRHLELAWVVAATSSAEGLTTLIKTDTNANRFKADFRAGALVAAAARNTSDLENLKAEAGWMTEKRTEVPAWTDDYSNIVSALIRKKLDR